MDKRETPGIFFYMNFTYNIHNNLLKQTLKKEDISLSILEYLVLWAIIDNPEISQYELSKQTGYTSGRINQTVQSLTLKKFLKKEPDYSSKIRLVLTATGISTIEKIQSEMFRYLKNYTSEEDYRNLSDFYKSLKAFSLSLMKNPKFRNL